MDRNILLFCTAALWTTLALGRGQTHDNEISPASYHVCRDSVTLNVSKLVPYQKPREESTLCMGWIPWKLCTRTYYQTEYRTIYVPETTAMRRCCEGYELVGRYCALSREQSSPYNARPGKCPNINGGTSGPRCTCDYDCPGHQKCCMSSHGSFCAAPASLAPDPNITSWYNVTITIKMAFDELIRLDNGFVNHTRLLHAMVTGELWPLEAAVYHMSTRAAGPFSVLSHILIGLNESHSLPHVTLMLNQIVARLPEVIDVQIDGMYSCLYPEPGLCPPHPQCIMEGSYNCSYGHNVNSTNPPPTRPGFITEPIPPHPPEFTEPLTASTLMGTTIAPPCYCSAFINHNISHVTSSAFQMHWSTGCPDHTVYHIDVWTSQGFHRHNVITGTSMNISGLDAGELYSTRVTFQDCDGLQHMWEKRVKTEGNVLNGTLKIQNRNLTESLLQPNSSDYTAFVNKFVSEVKKALSNEIPPDWVRVQIQSLKPGSIIVNFRIVVTDAKDPIGLTAWSFSALNNSGEFRVDLDSIVITDYNECLSPADNDCHPHADCRNLNQSYTCECHSSFVDRDPSRPGRNCEGVSSPSSGPWTSANSITDVYSTGHINSSHPTIMSATGHITVTTPATATASEPHDPATAATEVSSSTPVPRDPRINQSEPHTPVSRGTDPATPPTSTTVHDPSPSAPHKISATNATVLNTAVTKTSAPTSSTMNPVTDHGAIPSSTSDKGIIPVVSMAAKQTATSNISCSFAGASTDATIEATSTPLLMPASRMTTQQMSPSLTLRDASKAICQMGRIGVTIEKAFLKMMSVSMHSLFLGSRECSLNCTTDAFILIHAGWKECNTEVYDNKTHIVVNTTLYIDVSSTFLNMTPRAISTIRCVFQNNILWSSASNPAGGLFKIIENIEGGGSFFPEFQLFIGDQPIPANFTLSASDDITVQIRIKTEESQFKVVINECWATPTEDSNSPVSFPFIRDSCALANTFTTIHTNGISSNATFQTKIFSYVNNPIVYLHCQLHVCKEEPPATCKPSCSGLRSVMSGKNVFSGVTRMGPLLRASSPHVTDSSPPSSLGPGYIALIAIAVLASVTVVVAVLVCWHQRRTGNYSFKLKSLDTGYQVFSG